MRIVLTILCFVTSCLAQSRVEQTICASGCDETSITNWEGNLDDSGTYSSGDTAVGILSENVEFNEQIQLDGGSTIGLNQIIITVDEAYRHNGTELSGARWNNTGFGDNLRINNTVPVITEWIEFYGGGNDDACIELDAGDLIIRNCLIRDSADHGIQSDGGDTDILNSIIYNNAENGVFYSSASTVEVYNSTVINNTAQGIGGFGGPTVTVRNTISLSNGTDYNNIDTQSFSISSDATATGTGSLTNRTMTENTNPGAGDWVVFADISAGSEDFHLADAGGENDAIDAGTDLGTTPDGVETDIDGDTRGNDWDIGSDEFVAAPSPSGEADRRRVIIIN